MKSIIRGRHRERKVWTRTKWEKQPVDKPSQPPILTSHEKWAGQLEVLCISTRSFNHHLWKPPGTKITQRGKLLKQIDSLNCPSLRPQLEMQLGASEAASITTRERRTKKCIFTDKKHKSLLLMLLFYVLCLF
jgi:hypothetical protein